MNQSVQFRPLRGATDLASTEPSRERIEFARAESFEIGTIPPEVSVVMPCLNESLTLGTCIQKAFAALKSRGIRGEVIVADTMNGQPLDAKSGPFKLVVTEDKRPARWVRNLVSIELKSAK